MRSNPARTAIALVACAAVLVAWTAAAREGAIEADAWRTGGEVRYEARDALATWSGVAPLEVLDLFFDPDDLGALRLEAVVLPAAFDSGSALRDARARRSVFDSERFPEARLVAVAAPGGGGAAAGPRTPVALTLDAELTLHGVTLPYRIEVRLTAEADADGHPRYLAETVFEVSLSAHGMRRPALLALVTDDLVRVSVTAWAHPDPGPSSTTR
jgi:polyisoprenoid-binding protein YceI